MACSNNVKSFKKSVNEVWGWHADYVSICEGAAYEVDAAVPAEALIDDGTVHLVIWMMYNPNTRWLQIGFAVACLAYHDCYAYAMEHAGSE